MKQTTEISQHFVTDIEITKTEELPGGSKTRDIIIKTEDGKALTIDVFGDTEEDLEVNIK